jgi:hypothetical protein
MATIRAAVPSPRIAAQLELYSGKAATLDRLALAFGKKPESILLEAKRHGALKASISQRQRETTRRTIERVLVRIDELTEKWEQAGTAPDKEETSEFTTLLRALAQLSPAKGKTGTKNKKNKDAATHGKTPGSAPRPGPDADLFALIDERIEHCASKRIGLGTRLPERATGASALAKLDHGGAA